MIIKLIKFINCMFPNTVWVIKNRKNWKTGIFGLCHMAGFYQPQHFFAARCVFTDFEVMITATIWLLVSKVSMVFSIWGFGTSGFLGAKFFDAIFMAPGPSKVVCSLKLTPIWRFCFAIFSVKNASTEKKEYTTSKSAEKRKR